MSVSFPFAAQVRILKNDDQEESQKPSFKIIKVVCPAMEVIASSIIEVTLARATLQSYQPAGTVITIHGGNAIVTLPGGTAPVLNDDGTLTE